MKKLQDGVIMQNYDYDFDGIFFYFISSKLQSYTFVHNIKTGRLIQVGLILRDLREITMNEKMD